MVEKLRVGLIGVGMMGNEHLRNLELMPDARVAAIADPTPGSLDWARATLGDKADGVEAFADGAEMLAKVELDAVIIVSPNFTHRKFLEAALATNVAILCEKPLCSDLADARWAAEAADARTAKTGALFWTAMEYRFMPPAAEFIRRVHAGDVGKLAMLSIREHRFPFLVKVGDWNRFSANTGGTMVEKCCHFFDLMRLIVKGEPVSVFCSGAMDVNHLDERYDGKTPDIIDNSYTVVEFDNGVRAMLDLCMFAEGVEEQETLTATGSQARLEALIPPGDLVFAPRVPLGAPKKVVREHVPVDEAAMKAGTHHGSTFYQLRAFLDAVRDGGTAVVTARDGLMAVAIGTAAEISAREKRVVTLAELGF
ncbi:Gfo/Idh/MocA family protein [Caulobacter hibisci]|uniref:Gfo/Idh/MocA family oxidoreductase n=1 Tax=Caulobacter hibisci TaxID=2035993 RepID=A0ABS0T120_9CAUL|nr:Gfo/Idh/MocA family oxidoreductase [Caulobacter hibisci]MBI1685568.1 Gfo/Idh/MocA family oxidoreductase [Caulobacter hibisci]